MLVNVSLPRVVGEREVLFLSFTEKFEFQRLGLVIHRHRVHKSELALPECDAPTPRPIPPSDVTSGPRIHIGGEMGEGERVGALRRGRVGRQSR